MLLFALAACAKDNAGDSDMRNASEFGTDTNTDTDSHTDGDGDRDTNTISDGGLDSDGEYETSDTGSSDDSGLPRLCIFDYDLTLTTHDCAETEDHTDYFCRDTLCSVYGWSTQCIAPTAHDAIRECVRRKAYIGIASRSDVDDCWEGKVLPILSEDQFPEFVQSPYYDASDGGLSYPALDDRDNWNCEDCAYHMNPGMDKPDDIRAIMRHYGLAPDDPVDRARVIFWDDSPSNIDDVETQMPEVTAVQVPRHGEHGNDGGCGITEAAIADGWSEALKISI